MYVDYRYPPYMIRIGSQKSHLKANYRITDLRMNTKNRNSFQDLYMCHLAQWNKDKTKNILCLLSLESPYLVISPKDIIIRDKVIKMAKLRKMFIPDDTRGQQQSRVVKERGPPASCWHHTTLHHYIQKHPTYNKEQFMLPLWQKESKTSKSVASSVP